MRTIEKAGYLWIQGATLWWKSYRDKGRVTPRVSEWLDTRSNAFGDERVYVVQTNVPAIQHCILLTTDPGDLVLDPTCGSGTTAYVAEQWGRRWITIDTSRVALALARARIMGARYPYYLLADSPEGQQKEAEIADSSPPGTTTRGNVRLGFVNERVPHITLKSIANNTEIDVIWERWQETLERLRAELNDALGCSWEEWEIPREPGDPWREAATMAWNKHGAAETVPAKEAALHSLNRALRRDYTLDNVPDSPRDTSRAVRTPDPRNARRSSSVQSSAPSRDPIWSLPPGRRRTSASTCWSLARSTTRPTRRSSGSSAASPSSRRE